MRLTMLGLPAAGKGTQGILLGERYGIPHISTGSMFRAAISSGSSLGKLAKKYIDKGHLVPDDVALAIVQERLGEPDCQHGYVLDGFPRTVPQAEAFDKVLQTTGKSLDAAVDIRISDKEAIVRILERRVCSSCSRTYYKRYLKEQGTDRCEACGGELIRRADDTEETARERLRVYLAQTHPVVAYYGQSNRLVQVNGEQEIDQVFAELVQSLESKKPAIRTRGVVS